MNVPIELKICITLKPEIYFTLNFIRIQNTVADLSIRQTINTPFDCVTLASEEIKSSDSLTINRESL